MTRTTRTEVASVLASSPPRHSPTSSRAHPPLVRASSPLVSPRLVSPHLVSPLLLSCSPRMPCLACFAYPRLVSPPRLCSPTPPRLAHLVSPSPLLPLALPLTSHRPPRPLVLPHLTPSPRPLVLPYLSLLCRAASRSSPCAHLPLLTLRTPFARAPSLPSPRLASPSASSALRSRSASSPLPHPTLTLSSSPCARAPPFPSPRINLRLLRLRWTVAVLIGGRRDAVGRSR
ncbi:hypothetical protein CPC08DRAFT_771006 [Agrocybe pediades]|nr:hypothetical protein CPC08DRAFT_771006 [Agrocybe pediades]